MVSLAVPSALTENEKPSAILVSAPAKSPKFSETVSILVAYQSTAEPYLTTAKRLNDRAMQFSPL